MYIPALASEVRAAGVPGTAVEIPGGQETILVLDDEAPLLDATAATLEQFGYRVLEASTVLDRCPRRAEISFTRATGPP